MNFGSSSKTVGSALLRSILSLTNAVPFYQKDGGHEMVYMVLSNALCTNVVLK